MCSKILTAVLFLSVSTAFALEPKVEVTSFKFAVSKGYIAELCGKVTGIEGLNLVKILVDPKSKKPANYTVMVDGDGSFCTALVTFYGQAEASIGNSQKLLVTIE